MQFLVGHILYISSILDNVVIVKKKKKNPMHSGVMNLKLMVLYFNRKLQIYFELQLSLCSEALQVVVLAKCR